MNHIFFRLFSQDKNMHPSIFFWLSNESHFKNSIFTLKWAFGVVLLCVTGCVSSRLWAVWLAWPIKDICTTVVTSYKSKRTSQACHLFSLDRNLFRMHFFAMKICSHSFGLNQLRSYWATWMNYKEIVQIRFATVAHLPPLQPICSSLLCQSSVYPASMNFLCGLSLIRLHLQHPLSSLSFVHVQTFSASHQASLTLPPNSSTWAVALICYAMVYCDVLCADVAWNTNKLHFRWIMLMHI